MPTIDAFVTVRLQIIFFQQNYFDELGGTPTYIANTVYAAQCFQNPSVTVSTLHFYDTPHFIEINDCKNFLMEKSAVIILLIRI